jgi:hypothetical protein
LEIKYSSSSSVFAGPFWLFWIFFYLRIIRTTGRSEGKNLSLIRRLEIKYIILGVDSRIFEMINYNKFVETLKEKIFSKESNCIKNKIQKTNCIQKSLKIKKIKIF